MCSVCYGLGNCPVCEPDEIDSEQELDDQLNAADDYNYEAKLNELFNDKTEQP